MLAKSKWNSIYIQLLRLLILSALAAALIFWGMSSAGDYLVESYYDNSDYENKNNERYIAKLQEYAQNNEITSKDTKSLNNWVKKQKVLSISIYKDGYLYFDSNYPDQKFWEQEIQMDHFDWKNYYDVTFADGVASVDISGIYEYQLFNYALVIEIIVSFALFLLFVLLGIRKKIEYIKVLRDELEILEGGSLDYEISVRGKDELTSLAEGLNSMRLSFQKLISKEEDMLRENQRIVTEMSHDIRTPITSIMLFTEILLKGGIEDPQKREYVEKIEQKTKQVKQLTEHLFEYSLISAEDEVTLEEPEKFEVLFYDIFSETSSYLFNEGYEMETDIQWTNHKIRINTNYVLRIMDNLTSNILKYADKTHPVILSLTEDNGMTGFKLENTILKSDEKIESNGIGIQNICNMMKKMGGNCFYKEDESKFKISLLFPNCDN